MKLTIHIGTRKTGTTSIQAFLRKNKENLFKSGIYVLDYSSLNQYEFALASDISHNLTYYIKKLSNSVGYEFKKYSDDFFYNFEKELNSLPKNINKVIVSCEDCSLLDNNSIKYLKDRISVFFDSIEIISYFRRQDRYVASNVTTALRSGFNVCLDDIFNKNDIRHLLYNEIMENWSDHFGRENIKCRIFEKESLIENNLISDFLFTAQINNIPNLDISTISSNESIDIVTAKCIEAYNNSERLKNEPEDFRNSLIKKIKNNNELKFLPERKLAVDFMTVFYEENKKFKANFFNQSCSFFNNSFDEYPNEPYNKEKLNGKVLELLLEKLISEEKANIENIKTLESLNKEIDFLKNLSKRYEDLGDTKTALNLLEICKKIRPNGQYINNKIKELQ